MTSMIAAKSMRYATRHLEAGDKFDALSARDARILNAIGKARYATADARPAQASPGSPAAELLAHADGMNFMAFKAAAAKILGDETPAKKAEIVAALQSRAGGAR